MADILILIADTMPSMLPFSALLEGIRSSIRILLGRAMT